MDSSNIFVCFWERFWHGFVCCFRSWCLLGDSHRTHDSLYKKTFFIHLIQNWPWMKDFNILSCMPRTVPERTILFTKTRFPSIWCIAGLACRISSFLSVCPELSQNGWLLNENTIFIAQNCPRTHDSLHESTSFIHLIHNWFWMWYFSIPSRMPRTVPELIISRKQDFDPFDCN